MGRGDNRRTPKHRRRKQQRRLKARIKAKIAGGGKTTPRAKAAPKKAVAKTVTRRAAEE